MGRDTRDGPGGEDRSSHWSEQFVDPHPRQATAPGRDGEISSSSIKPTSICLVNIVIMIGDHDKLPQNTGFWKSLITNYKLGIFPCSGKTGEPAEAARPQTSPDSELTHGITISVIKSMNKSIIWIGNCILYTI